MARRSRGEQTEHGLASVAAEEENELFSVGGYVFSEGEAGGAYLSARQPDFPAIVANRRRRLK